MARDQRGNYHIVYIHPEAEGFGLSYVRSTGTSENRLLWATHTLIDESVTPPNDNRLSLAIDPQGNIHVAYLDRGANLGVVKYAILEQGTTPPRSVIVVPTDGQTALSPTMGIDSQGKAFVAYSSWSRYESGFWKRPIRLTTNASGAWTTGIVREDPSFGNLGKPYLAIGSDGRVHVVYTVHSGESTVVEYATVQNLSTESWTRTIVAQDAILPFGESHPGLVVDRGNTAHFTVLSGVNSDVGILAHVSSVDGALQQQALIESVRPSVPPPILSASIGVTDDDVAHVAYYSLAGSDRVTSGEHYDLVYGRRTRNSTVWEKTVIEHKTVNFLGVSSSPSLSLVASMPEEASPPATSCDPGGTGHRCFDPSGRFVTDDDEGGCRDTHTGLVWSCKAPQKKSWFAAEAYCHGLAEGGKRDWALMGRRRMRDIAGSVSNVFAFDIDSSFWSATRYSPRPPLYYVVNLLTGQSPYQFAPTPADVICGRAATAG